MRRALTVMSLAALALTLIADPAAAEARRRTVNVYNWTDYVDPGVLEDFTKATGIALRYDTFDSNDVLEAKLLAGRSGYDVVVPTAYFLERQIKAGIFARLDKSKLPNLVHMWPEITQRLAQYDPGNVYGVNYMWGTTGIGYNLKKSRELLGGDGQIDSWDAVFKPDQLAKFKDCGVHMLDSSDDILSAALHYLGLDPNTKREADYQKAADLLVAVRPSVRKFHSSEYLSALATGEICFAVGFSGDVNRRRSARQRPRTASRSLMRFRRRGRNCGSTISPFRATPATSPKPMNSSITCSSPRSPPGTRTSSPTPTATWRARNSSTRTYSRIRPSTPMRRR